MGRRGGADGVARGGNEAQAAPDDMAGGIETQHGVDEGVPFIVMELLEGESLAKRLERLLGSRPFESDTLGGLLLAICARDIPVPSRGPRSRWLEAVWRGSFSPE